MILKGDNIPSMNRKKKKLLLSGIFTFAFTIVSVFILVNSNKNDLSLDAATSTKQLTMTSTVLSRKYFVTPKNNRVNITVSNFNYNSSTKCFDASGFNPGYVTNTTAIRRINYISCAWYNDCSAEALKFEILDANKKVIASKTGAGLTEDYNTGKFITSGTLKLTTSLTTGRYFKVTILAYSAGTRRISGFVVDYTCD